MHHKKYSAAAKKLTIPASRTLGIDGLQSAKDARELLNQHRDGELVSHRVSREVNSNRAKGAELIAPI